MKMKKPNTWQRGPPNRKKRGNRNSSRSLHGLSDRTTTTSTTSTQARMTTTGWLRRRAPSRLLRRPSWTHLRRWLIMYVSVNQFSISNLHGLPIKAKLVGWMAKLMTWIKLKSKLTLPTSITPFFPTTWAARVAGFLFLLLMSIHSSCSCIYP